MSFPFVKLKLKRESLGLTRKELSERCGLPARQIESLEQGRKPNPTLDTLVALCKGLGVECSFFFTEDDSPPPPPVIGRPKKPDDELKTKRRKAK